MKIDPRSDRTVLFYEGEPVANVPARDLTENDIARLVFVEHGDLSGAALTNATEKLIDRLTAGPYRKTAPAEPSAKSHEGEPS